MTDMPMNQDRQNAVRLMCSRGWQHRRENGKHRFLRPDGSGLLDVAQISHRNLSLEWAITHCGDAELAKRVALVRRDWVIEALHLIETEATP